jgi:hypothetical protein
VLGVEVNGPDPVHLPVRAKTADVHREIIEPVATGRLSGLVDQGDGHAVIGVDATAVLVKGATERRPELHEHERQVVLAAGAVPGSGAWAIFLRDIRGEEVESGCVIALQDRIEYGLGTVEVGMVTHLCLQCRECVGRPGAHVATGAYCCQFFGGRV